MNAPEIASAVPSVRSRWRGAAVLLLAWVFAMAIVLRVPILSGFDLGFGDRADAIIEISILEHWRNVLLGYAAWNETGYFHPYPNTLGYNDGYFLFGLVYSFWRTFADPFLADTLNIATWKTIGFFAAWALARRSLGWERPIAILVALLFTIANNLMVQAVHAQIQVIALLPVILILAIAGVRAEAAGAKLRARVIGALGAALLAAWLMTAYYMAWFTLFFTLLLVPCWLFAAGRWRPSALLALGRAHGATIAITGGAFAVLVVPFLLTYLPKAAETGGHGYWKTLGYLATPVVDWINVGRDNLVWGWIPRLFHAALGALVPGDLGLAGRAIGGEHESGFPLFLFALVVASLWSVLVRNRTSDGAAPSPFLRAYALAILIGWALITQLWIASPWGLVFEAVPGARGLRVVLRFQLFLVLPLLLLVFAVQRARIARIVARSPAIAAALALLLVAEQLTAFHPAELSRSASIAALETLPPPPPGCTSFYVVTARTGEAMYRNPEQDSKYPHNVDAMYLAQRWRLPTINGYSTFNPPDWNFRDSRAPDYDTRVRAYARKHRLAGLCRLDARNSPEWAQIGS